RVLALSPAFPHLTPPPPAPALSPLSLHDALPISSLPGWVGRFKELETGADSLVEVTRKLATDVEDEARSEILAWASAVRDSVRSHARDLEGDDFSLVRRLSALASVAEEMVQPMEFQFLFDPSRRLVVGRQIRYGAERGVPWGISESAYNVRDAAHTYQYSDFGVPGLGLKRGLFEDVVVAPYATALAAMVNPRAALDNFSRLDEAGALGAYGFYDALDYTPSRLPEKTRVAVVRAYMAHHQGMTVVSIGNVVHDGATQRRFHSHPMVQAAELLLQERTPRSVAVTRPRGEEELEAAHVRDLVPPTLRR